MKSELKIGEAEKNFMKNSVSSTFYRLEKKIYLRDFVYYDVYDFHKVCNGNMYCRHTEEPINNGKRSLGRRLNNIEFGFNENAKIKGNKKYEELKNNGYTFAGVFESDICGYAKRIK